MCENPHRRKSSMPAMHEVDYKIFGDDMQFVEVELDPGEAAVAEAGGMFYMEDGIIMERLDGDGWAFVHAGGMLIERTLAPGEVLRVDTGCLVALQPSVNYDIEYVGRIKSALFGGEGVFFATLRGPGRIWLQSLPLSRLARRIVAAAPQTGRKGREEGSVLGTIGDILSGAR